MKQPLFCSLAVALFAIGSCKKNDDDNKTTTVNRWVLNGNAHNVTSCYRINSGFYDEVKMISNLDTMSCMFTAFPTANGSYLVQTIFAAGATGQMGVIVNEGSTTYGTTGSEQLSASITVNNGKISINMPDVWIVNVLTSDSVKLSATVVEP